MQNAIDEHHVDTAQSVHSVAKMVAVMNKGICPRSIFVSALTHTYWQPPQPMLSFVAQGKMHSRIDGDKELEPWMGHSD
jgi:hypothetical protein